MRGVDFNAELVESNMCGINLAKADVSEAEDKAALIDSLPKEIDSLSLLSEVLNVDLSTVTTAADLILGLGEPLEDIIHLDFQEILETP